MHQDTVAGRNVTFKTLGWRVMAYLWLSRVIQLLEVRCRHFGIEEVATSGASSSWNSLKAACHIWPCWSCSKITETASGWDEAPLRPHELLLYQSISQYQQKARKTEFCLRLLRSKDAEPREAQCNHSAMSTAIKFCSNIGMAGAFHFPLGRWQLALEPGF